MSEWSDRWFVWEYGNREEFHSLARQNGAIVTYPGSGSTAWFETQAEAESFSRIYSDTTGRQLEVTNGASFSIF